MNNKYTLYSKSGCKYCTFAKNDFLAMQKNGVDIRYEEINLDDEMEKEAFKARHPTLTTLPQVFAPGGDYIGGYEELTKHFSTMIDFGGWV